MCEQSRSLFIESPANEQACWWRTQISKELPCFGLFWYFSTFMRYSWCLKPTKLGTKVQNKGLQVLEKAWIRVWHPWVIFFFLSSAPNAMGRYQAGLIFGHFENIFKHSSKQIHQIQSKLGQHDIRLVYWSCTVKQIMIFEIVLAWQCTCYK